MNRPNIQTPNYGRLDPSSSIRAAKYLAPLRGKKQAQVLALVQKYPGRTAWELAQCAALDAGVRHAGGIGAHRAELYPNIQKRLSDLKGVYVYQDPDGAPCKIKHRSACRWRPMTWDEQRRCQ